MVDYNAELLRKRRLQMGAPVRDDGLLPFDVREFVFETPLYEVKSLDARTNLEHAFTQGAVRIDGYCPYCTAQSVFVSDTRFAGGNLIEIITGRISCLTFICARDEAHSIAVYVHVEGELDKHKINFRSDIQIQKIGQFPSHADIANQNLAKFDRVLTKQDRIEIIRANGLAAHGVNVGAFVYLRRVIERLVEEIFQKQERSDEEWNSFRRLRMNERIESLRDKLPPFMVENRSIYGFVSKGIHELNEDQCGQYYQVMLHSILLILQQKGEAKEREEQEKQIRAALSKIKAEN